MACRWKRRPSKAASFEILISFGDFVVEKALESQKWSAKPIKDEKGLSYVIYFGSRTIDWV